MNKKSSSDCSDCALLTPTKSTISRRRRVRNKASKIITTNVNRANNDDYFDESIMDMIGLKLAELSKVTGLDLSGNGREITFHSKVIGRFCSQKGDSVKLLLTWEPEGLIPDEWVTEKDLDEMSTRCVPINSLPISSLTAICEKSFTPASSRGRKIGNAC